MAQPLLSTTDLLSTTQLLDAGVDTGTGGGFIASQALTQGAANSVSVPRPSGTTTNDTIVVGITVFDHTVSIVPPSGQGWLTALPVTQNVNGGFATAVFYRVDNGTSGPWTFTTTGAGWVMGDALTYRGLATTGTLEAVGTPYVSSFTEITPAAPAVTTISASALVLAYVTWQNTRAVLSGPGGGYTLRSLTTPWADGTAGTTPGTVPAATFSLDNYTHVITQQFAFNAGGTGGSAPANTIAPAVTPPTAGVGTLLTCGQGQWNNTPLSYAYQWKRGATNIGTNANTYTTVSGDLGQNITCVVTATNASGSGSATSNTVTPSGAGAPANTSLPTITGTPAVGATITGHIGSWSNTPTSYSYEFRWLRTPTMNFPTGDLGYQTIPGTAGTTSSSATTPTYVMGRNDASQAIFFHVVATNASGAAAADSTSVIFYQTPIPFKAAGSPFLTPQAGSNPVYHPTLTATWQSQIASYRAASVDWWNQGGNYADNFAVYVHRVDSSMPRTPFLVAGGGTYGGHDFRNPKATPVKNGGIEEHLAWTVGNKTLADMGLSGASGAGIPTPPGGFRVVGPDTGSVDAHLVVFCEDTFELWELWEAWFILPGGSLAGTPYSTDYDNRWVCFWGGYMRDVREHDGRWFASGFGSSRYRLDVNGNFEYAGWGGTATSLAVPAMHMLMKELLVDSEIGHGLGIIMPGHDHTFAWPASREAAGEPGGLVNQGGWIVIDPSLNLATLPTLGSAPKDAYRLRLLTALQKFGMTNFDSTGSIMSFKQEAMGGTWPNIPHVDDQGGCSMNEVLDSVPNNMWKVLSPSWRPAGYVGNAKTSTITDTWTSLNTAIWQIGGTVTASGGQLSLTSTGSNVAVWPQAWSSHSLVGSTLMCQTVTMPVGATKNSFGLQPLNSEWSSKGIVFNIFGGNLRCELYDWWGNVQGTSTSISFNATNHKWLRLRMNADHSVDWQTSVGGTVGSDPNTWTWVTQRTATPDIDLEDANIVWELTGPATTNAVWGLLNTTVTGGLPPVKTADPVVSPTTAVTGTGLSCTNGSWNNNPTGFTYQWRRFGWGDLAGATLNTYTVVAADVASAITCVVTASNPSGSASATSNAVTPTAAAAPVNTVLPAVTPASVAVPGVLSVTDGFWNNNPTSFAYQWKRSAGNISGATNSSYTTQAADVGLPVTCTVTATNATGSTGATSNTVTPTAVDTTPPAAPVGLVVTGRSGSIALDWSDNTEPDLNPTTPYLVERATAVGGPFTQIATTVASDYVDFTVTPGVTYYYRVRAEDNAP